MKYSEAYLTGLRLLAKSIFINLSRLLLRFSQIYFFPKLIILSFLLHNTHLSAPCRSEAKTLTHASGLYAQGIHYSLLLAASLLPARSGVFALHNAQTFTIPSAQSSIFNYFLHLSSFIVPSLSCPDICLQVKH